MKQRKKGGRPKAAVQLASLTKSGSLAMLLAMRSSLIKSQTIDNLSIARIGVAVDIGQNLSVRVYDLEAAV